VYTRRTRVLSFHSFVDVHGALAALQSRSSSWKALKLQCFATRPGDDSGLTLEY
jgi:hypothetical protein